jgi:spoIIIJ-associated protein
MAKVKLDENLVAKNVKELIEMLNVSATAEISKIDNTYFVDVSSEDSSLLIGKQGANLESLQFILAVRLKSETQSDDFEIFLDIDGWRKQKEQRLEKMASSIAQRVEETGKEEFLYDLRPSERRVIHSYLTSHPTVTTVSEGEGDARYLIIKPK